MMPRILWVPRTEKLYKHLYELPAGYGRIVQADFQPKHSVQLIIVTYLGPGPLTGKVYYIYNPKLWSQIRETKYFNQGLLTLNDYPY